MVVLPTLVGVWVLHIGVEIIKLVDNEFVGGYGHGFMMRRHNIGMDITRTA